MNTFSSSNIITKEVIENLQIGDILPNVFGQMKAITRITAKGTNVQGKAYACFYQQFGETSEMSHSIGEGSAVTIFFGENRNH